MVAEGAANWFGENSSLLASRRYTKCALNCSNSHSDGHSGVNTEFMWWLGESVSELVDEVEAVNKFVGRNGSDV
jgi:hypothetical protein